MKVGRFFLIACLGWLGSFIINHTGLKPEGWKSRSWAYFILRTLRIILFIVSQLKSLCQTKRK